MKRVMLESPLRGDIAAHNEYARRAMLDSLSRGEHPFASHLLYTQVLNDSDEDDRRRGLWAAEAWRKVADAVILYVDYGISAGMQEAVEQADLLDLPVIHRSIGKNARGKN